jgi:hypothetical protein
MAIVLSEKWHHSSLRPYRVTADNALVAAILFCREFSYAVDNTI